MTILKKLMYLCSVAVALVACNPDDDGPVVPLNSGDNARVSHSFEATLDLQRISGYPIEYEPVLMLSVSYNGAGTSTLMPEMTLEATHTEEMVTVYEDGTYIIREGDFVLRGLNGDTIYGSYTGHGSQNPTNFYMNWTFQILGGSGQFFDAQGSLSAAISGPGGTKPGPAGPWETTITGKVHLEDQN